jgi:hypothetical protein
MLFASCSEKDDVGAIRALIKEAAVLAEDHDIGGIMDLTTEDFQALPGKMDRRRAKRLVWLVFKKYGQLRVVHPVPSVEVEEGSATARFPFLIIRKDRSLPALKEFYQDPKRWVEEVGEAGDLFNMRLLLMKRGDEWLVTRAHVKRIM